MSWQEWMVVTQSLEEELEVERHVREIQNCDDETKVKELAVQLLRQNFHTGKLLAQAVGRIGELDAAFACSDTLC